MGTEVERQIRRLESMSYGELERAVAAKRIEWLQREHPHGTHEACTPRMAFELLFRDYMGLSLGDLPVLVDTGDEIAWRSENHCPTLEAANELGRDTREVCRAVYEKPTQAFVSWLDPELRFLRSYEQIRPHADHCLERIVRVDFEAMMRLALEQAALSKRSGNKGYGAVVAVGKDVISTAYDTSGSEGDPSLHAEVNAIRAAVRVLADSDLTGAVLFSTCEPCPMCSSLAVWANVTTIVYGASIAETAALGRSRILVDSRHIAEGSPRMVEIVGGVLADECLNLYR